MNKIVRILMLFTLAMAGFGAHAQRTLVPIVGFENIPVAIATPARLTSEQVKQAFIAAGEESRWNIVPQGDGTLEGTFIKGGKHTVVVTIRYDGDKYSVAYKSSDNMNHRDSQYPNALASPSGGQSMAAQAISKQRALFAARPETPYLKADPKAVIHPFYEHWVYDLLDKVRVKLKRIA